MAKTKNCAVHFLKKALKLVLKYFQIAIEASLITAASAVVTVVKWPQVYSSAGM